LRMKSDESHSTRNGKIAYGLPIGTAQLREFGIRGLPGDRELPHALIRLDRAKEKSRPLKPNQGKSRQFKVQKFSGIRACLFAKA
ncbi:MAG: hypothetical protein ABJF10_24090, partial [Chthoniobacter sp.]|uniref:hypothetical protein n=1 Tax=Chthoniobacter sp. TaxID=2510640 RepID=UPI0032A6F606